MRVRMRYVPMGAARIELALAETANPSERRVGWPHVVEAQPKGSRFSGLENEGIVRRRLRPLLLGIHRLPLFDSLSAELS